MLSPEDQLVQLSVHAHKHRWEGLIWLKDIDLLLRAHGPTLNWRLVVDVARREGVTASVWYTMLLAKRLLGTPIPSTVATPLQPMPLVRVLYGAVWPIARIAGLDAHMRRR